MILVITGRCREAVAMMPHFLPPPHVKRHTTKGLHWVYSSDEAETDECFSDGGVIVVESRAFRTMAEACAWIARDGGEAVQ